MPLVERRQREVSTAPLPGVRKTAAATAVSEGANVEAAKVGIGQSIAGLGATVGRMGAQKFAEIQQQARNRADSVAILEAERKIGEWENKRLYDPETGALNVRGKEAMALPDTLANEFATLTGEIEKGLGSDRQRDAFNRVKTSRGMGLDLTIQRHVFGEMNRYEAEELKATVENAQQSAIANALDPARVGVELDRAVGAIKTHAPRLGLGPEAIEKQVAAVTSSTHVGVIERLLSTDRDKAAKAYFEETRGQINGDAIAKVERAIDEGSLRGESQRAADEIILAGGTLTEQRAKVRAIEDPKLRDAVQTRIEHEAAVREREEREAEEATLQGAYNIVDKTGNVNSIPSPTWSGLTGGARSALRNYAEHIARGVPVKTDLPTFYGLMKKAGDDPAAFVTENLLQYRHKLDEVEFKQLAGLQLSIRSGNTKAAEKDLAGFRTNAQILDDSLRQYGIQPDGKEQTDQEKVAIAQLRRMLDQRVEAQSALTGKKPTNVDIQQAVDDLLSASAEVRQQGTWGGLFSAAPFFDTTTTKRLIDMQPGDVPEQFRAQIVATLQKARRPVSETTILDMYLEARARGLIK